MRIYLAVLLVGMFGLTNANAPAVQSEVSVVHPAQHDDDVSYVYTPAVSLPQNCGSCVGYEVHSITETHPMFETHAFGGGNGLAAAPGGVQEPRSVFARTEWKPSEIGSWNSLATMSSLEGDCPTTEDQRCYSVQSGTFTCSGSHGGCHSTFGDGLCDSGHSTCSSLQADQSVFVALRNAPTAMLAEAPLRSATEKHAFAVIGSSLAFFDCDGRTFASVPLTPAVNEAVARKLSVARPATFADEAAS
jgi:hypothetical protein